jgi:RNA-directed DNA polymerase
MDSEFPIAKALAAAFLAGRFDESGLAERGARLLGRSWRWLRPLARRIVPAFADGPRPRLTTLTRVLRDDPGFQRACERHELRVVDWLESRAVMCPVPPARDWQVPPICSSGELAEWLGLSLGELDWFADVKNWEANRGRGRLRHYHYRPLTKRFGQVRLVEAPKTRLKALQRRILSEIVDRIVPHEAVHGFRIGRSITTFAGPHAGRGVVIRLDLQDFFPSIRVARIQALFRAVGYPETVADLLAGMCTNCVPWEVWRGIELPPADMQARGVCWLYGQPHLPQGAPTSPALANLVAYRMDCRLAALAEAAGGCYTRYADDLAFSGDEAFERSAQRFALHACAVAMEQGFRVHHRKTRIMRASVRQRLAGMVVNQRLNVPRTDYDRLKATLTNCVRQGPASQNREDHKDFRANLEGRVSFVCMVHPQRGRRLRELFQQIVW